MQTPLKIALGFTLAILTACTGIPEGITPVKNFEVDRYLGTWFEIARFDHRFERDLTQVTAEYSLREDGGVNVLNKGFVVSNKEWKSANAKAYFVGNKDVGHLKVSFFGPFYSSYIVFVLDHENYDYALVTSSSRDYFWILARDPQIAPEVRTYLIDQAKLYGFDTSKLIWVDQSLGRNRE